MSFGCCGFRALGFQFLSASDIGLHMSMLLCLGRFLGSGASLDDKGFSKG